MTSFFSEVNNEKYLSIDIIHACIRFLFELVLKYQILYLIRYM